MSKPNLERRRNEYEGCNRLEPTDAKASATIQQQGQAQAQAQAQTQVRPQPCPIRRCLNIKMRGNNLDDVYRAKATIAAAAGDFFGSLSFESELDGNDVGNKGGKGKGGERDAASAATATPSNHSDSAAFCGDAFQGAPKAKEEAAAATTATTTTEAETAKAKATTESTTNSKATATLAPRTNATTMTTTTTTTKTKTKTTTTTTTTTAAAAAAAAAGAARPNPPPQATVSEWRSGRRQASRDIAHRFHEQSYGAPTYCDICDGLLVGLWSQGLQCGVCGMNVHRGQGAGEHDDCRAEALLKACCGGEFGGGEGRRRRRTTEGGVVVLGGGGGGGATFADADGNAIAASAAADDGSAKTTDVYSSSSSAFQSKRDQKKVSIGQVVEELQKLAKSPGFLKEVSEQANRDLKAHVNKAIVTTGVREERTKKFRRFKNGLGPILARIEAMEERGAAASVAVMLLGQLAVMGWASTVAMLTSLLSLWPRFGLFTRESTQIAASHAVTVLATIQAQLAVLSMMAWYASRAFQRKSIIVDTFLREMFALDAGPDLGISVERAAEHARLWAGHAAWSCAGSCGVVALVWHWAQRSSCSLPPPPLPPFPPSEVQVSSRSVAPLLFCILAITGGMCWWLYAESGGWHSQRQRQLRLRLRLRLQRRELHEEEDVPLPPSPETPPTQLSESRRGEIAATAAPPSQKTPLREVKKRLAYFNLMPASQTAHNPERDGKK